MGLISCQSFAVICKAEHVKNESEVKPHERASFLPVEWQSGSAYWGNHSYNFAMSCLDGSELMKPESALEFDAAAFMIKTYFDVAPKWHSIGWLWQGRESFGKMCSSHFSSAIPSNDLTSFRSGSEPILFDRWCSQSHSAPATWVYSYLNIDATLDPCWVTYSRGLMGQQPFVCKSLGPVQSCVTTFPGDLGMRLTTGPVWKHFEASARWGNRTKITWWTGIFERFKQ